MKSQLQAMLPAVLLWGLCALTGTAQAQTKLLAQPIAWTPPRLVVNTANLQPIVLDTVKIDTEVHGTEALTRIELHFFNPNGRVLEGELQFPLLGGQSVIGMAMDVNGVLREAVPVDKAKGQEVFEDVIRQRIDPALLEKTQGNNFKLRVYPIPANGTKRVVLRILETLPLRKGNIVLRLPLNYADKLPHFDLALKVFSADAAPKASIGTQTGALVFARQGAVYEARLKREGFAQRDVLEVQVPAPSHASITTQRFNGQTYFRAAIPAPTAPPIRRSMAKHVALYWDASASGQDRDQAREFALLDAYFKAMGQGTVTLVEFRDVAEKPRTFSVQAGNWSQLKAHLAQTPFDGATRLGGLPKIAGAGEALLVSDGINNYGKEAFPALGVPVYALSSGLSADLDALQSLAERSGGRLIDLQRQTPEEAATYLLGDGVQVVDVGGDGVSQLVSESRLPQDGRFTLAGVVAPGGGSLRVQLRIPGKNATRTVDIAIPATQTGAPGSSLAALTWARLKLAELDGDYALKRGEIRRLGQEFRLTTRETSLIILDRAEDYARHGIEAPPELAVEVARLKAAGVTRVEADKGQHIERIVAQFQEKEKWWMRDFAKEMQLQADRKAKEAALAEASRRSASDTRVAMAPRLEAPPPPFVPPADRQPSVQSSAAPPPAPAPIAAPSPAPAAARAPVSGKQFLHRESAGQDQSETRAAPGRATVGIALQKWTPDAPYLRRLQSAPPEQLYAIYLDERPSWRKSSAFFLDVADLLADKGQTALALRVLSNIAEMNLENRHLLRILAYRLMQADAPKLAIPVLEKVLDLAPKEPQSHRDLGLAYAADQQTQKAVDALWEVVSTPWPRSFPGLPLIALAELNATIATARDKPDTSRIDPRLVKNLPLDLRVTLSWDADNSDMDLYVIDPNGEESYFGRVLSSQGGRMSPDCTVGYGPEEFSLKKALPGKYTVRAKFYGHRQQIVAGATTLQLKLQTGFGTSMQQEKVTTLRLQGQGSLVTVGEFEVK
ncbi:MAG: VIT domain-containing protein [Pseudomonadota bacterium]